VKRQSPPASSSEAEAPDGTQREEKYVLLTSSFSQFKQLQLWANPYNPSIVLDLQPAKTCFVFSVHITSSTATFPELRMKTPGLLRSDLSGMKMKTCSLGTAVEIRGMCALFSGCSHVVRMSLQSFQGHRITGNANTYDHRITGNANTYDRRITGNANTYDHRINLRGVAKRTVPQGTH
ncbi:hypothetical protein KUCAC02_030825, partial [Chaenocephalus aceratus]